MVQPSIRPFHCSGLLNWHLCPPSSYLTFLAFLSARHGGRELLVINGLAFCTACFGFAVHTACVERRQARQNDRGGVCRYDSIKPSSLDQWVTDAHFPRFR